MIIIIDNYDSFTFNLVQYVGSINPNLKVFKNDQITLDQVGNLKPKGLIISPGPGTPSNSGICIDLIKNFKAKLPILGICLGHQAIAEAFGAKIERARDVMHGKISEINHNGSLIFKDIPFRFNATRYHSLVAVKKNFPDTLKITSKTCDGYIMSIEHKYLPIYGVQFHPESILTDYGMKIIENYLNIINDDDLN
tara:strand:- start:233 stop:817 length:585 start_codon:yes stop_codon:yes gene_type:complete